MADPFTEVYQALFEALAGSGSALGSLVALAVDMSADGAVIPESAKCEQLPQLVLAQSGWGTSPGNSKASEVVQNYPLLLASSQKGVVDINALKWALLVSLEAAGCLGLSYVRDVRVSQASDSFANSKEKRGNEEWFAAAVIVVTMAIPKSSLVAGSGS